MRKIISIIIISIITFFTAILIFLTTKGIKTDNFNSLIAEKVKEIDPKIKLKLNQVNFKLNPSNFESSNPEKVLDGDIDNFLESSLYKLNA